MSLTTSCPACGTMFRIVPDQLKISDGWVRCGHCAEIFDARAHLAPEPVAATFLRPGPGAQAPESPAADGAPQAGSHGAAPQPGSGAVARPFSGDPVPEQRRAAPAFGTAAVDPASEARPADPVFEVAPPAPEAQAQAFAADPAPDPQQAVRRGEFGGADPATRPASDRPAPGAPSLPGEGRQSGVGGVVPALPAAHAPLPRGAPDASPPAPADAAPAARTSPATGPWGETGAAHRQGVSPGAGAGDSAAEAPADGAPAELPPSWGTAEAPPHWGTSQPPPDWDGGGEAPLEDTSAQVPLAARQVHAEHGPGAAEARSQRPKAPLPASAPVGRHELPELGFVREARRKAFWRRPLVRVGMALLALLLGVLLLLQWAWHDRDRLAAAEPRLAPWLQQACGWLGCRLALPRRIEAVVIESSGFTRLRDDTFRLAFTLRNTAAFALQPPAMELTLLDAQDQPVLRRVLDPAELGAPTGGLPAAGDWSASLGLSVEPSEGARIAGYRLLAFYP